MTTFQGQSKDLDNNRLFSQVIGKAYIPELERQVPWMGFGERAVLLTQSRNRRLRAIICQPAKVRLLVDGRWRHYTADYRFLYVDQPDCVFECKGAWALPKPEVRAKMMAAQMHFAAEGARFQALNGSELAWSAELANYELLFRYARVPVDDRATECLKSAVRVGAPMTLEQLATVASMCGYDRRVIYALMYRDVLKFDWHKRLLETTVISV